jgi:hypothetical protein
MLICSFKIEQMNIRTNEYMNFELEFRMSNGRCAGYFNYLLLFVAQVWNAMQRD